MTGAILCSCIINPLGTLPPETQVGANTFGCLVNGDVVIPNIKSSGISFGGARKNALEAFIIDDSEDDSAVLRIRVISSSPKYDYNFIYLSSR